MAKYVILIPGNEEYWDRSTAEEKQEMYGTHEKFAAMLSERGHTVTGGAELHHSREATTLRRGPGEVTVTEGPYAESVEQLTGFYTVETEDFDDLLEVCKVLGGVEKALEIRRVVTPEEREAML
jgi:hypothetical protein